MYYTKLLAVLIIAYISGKSAGVEANCLNEGRVCDDTPRTCYYDFKLETYSTMSKACANFPFINGLDLNDKPDQCVLGDGVAREVLTVNRRLPGTPIRVCEGDTVKVIIKNELTDGMGTSIHWHGIHNQDKVYMDGVAMITQCPILPYDTRFEYEFKAKPAGTHFYHAHVGMQRGEGIAGALVVLPTVPREDLPPHVDLPEHTLVIQDWFNRSAADKGIVHLHDGGKNWPDSIIVDGVAPRMVEKEGMTPTKIPDRIFTVVKGRSYRFRIISNAVMNCPIEIYIQDHRLDVIATDGADIERTEAKVLVVSGGERWDFLLHATENMANYWMYFRGIIDCNQTALQTRAIVHYEGAPDNSDTPNGYRDRPDDELTVNPFMGETFPVLTKGKDIKLTDLKPVKTPVLEWLNEDQAVKRFYIEIGLRQLNNEIYNDVKIFPCIPEDPTIIQLDKDGLIPTTRCTLLAQMDYVNGKLPSNPLYGQYDDINQAELCEVGSEKTKSCNVTFCHCVHYLKVEVNDIVELVLVDEGRYFNNSNHPMHIHGQYFHILAMGQSDKRRTNKTEVMKWDNDGLIKRNFDTPIEKDNIMMPVGGYVVVRFNASNPGPWLFHCHNELHVEQGMFMVIQVGEPCKWPTMDTPQMHKCGPYVPPKSKSTILKTEWILLFTCIITCWKFI